jgi:hypothetical protein
MKYPILAAALLFGLTVALTGCDAVAPDAQAPAPLLQPGAESASASAPVRLTFEKELLQPGVWEGTVDGAFSGDLRTELVSLREAGPIWHVVFDWIITGTAAGEFDLIARLNGTLNTSTGRVVMNGRVTDGYLEGARVHEEGQLVDPDVLGFEGIITIMPRTAR